MNFSLSKREKIILAVIILVSLAGLYRGWGLFWFLTDDAFIVFRYVSNNILGYGYVWNPPPFRPVEGYTSFLWMVILDIVWRVTGIEPPISANRLALFFSVGTLGLVISMTLLMKWSAPLRKHRLLFLAIVLFGVLTNRTFLAWTSSGLETSMFNFLVLLWLFIVMYFEHDNWKWLLSISLSTLLIYLSRPDGILYLGTTLLMVGFATKKIKFYNGWKGLFAMLPLLGIPSHFLWRYNVYGEYLPNTYYAKVAGVKNLLWLESGSKYLLSFIIEYSVWIWILIMFVWLLLSFRSGKLIAKIKNRFPNAVLPIITVIGHMLYYTVVVGGDYFEYRIYSYLIPLLFLSCVWVFNRLEFSSRVAFSVLVSFVILSLPIPWMHWHVTRDLYTIDDTLKLVAPIAGQFREVAPSLPDPIISYLVYYDDLQEWLINHYVCIRHQELKALSLRLQAFFPSRQVGEKVSGDYPVIAQAAAGVVGWILPHVNIIDLYGLNDYVIARNPDLRTPIRMAHLRMPPEGYVECFQPNIKIKSKEIIVIPRPEAMSAERIVYCEHHYLEIVLRPIESNP